MFNNKKKFEDIFKKEFNQTYDLDIKVNDFIPQDKLKSKKQVSISWKYATVFTIFLLAISTCILGIGMFKINNSVFIDNTFEYISVEDDSNILRDEDIKKISNYALSFSKMTFPHQLFRVLLLEQIYRSYKINNNESYHK